MVAVRKGASCRASALLIKGPMIMNRTSIPAFHPTSLTSKTPSTLITVVKRSWRAYVRWLENRAAMSELRSMSDHQLKDIGITRYDAAPLVAGEGVRERAFHFDRRGPSV